MFVLAGLGQKPEDIPIGTIKYIKKAGYVFLEYYTNVPNIRIERFLSKFRKDIKIVFRDFVETKLEKFLLEHKKDLVVLLVFASPLFATTHTSLLSFCKEHKIKVRVIGASSVYDYLAKTGLFIYKFGKTASISFHKSKVPYDILKYNYMIGAHTLFLLDIDPENRRYMTVNEALIRLLELEEEEKADIININSRVLICEKLGSENEKIYYVSIKKALDMVFNYPACIIFPVELNEIEKETLRYMSYYYEDEE